MKEKVNILIRKDKLNILLVLSSVFIAMLTISNVLAFKLIRFTSYLVAPAGVLAYSLTYIVTDVMVEIYGKKKVKFLVFAGFITQLLILTVIFIAVKLPSPEIFKFNKEFVIVLSQSSRIVFASLFAYFISQLWDINVFSFLKRKTKGRHLWLRNNLSTMSSQLLDSTIFITVAFIGVESGYSILNMIVGQYIVKLIIALLDTPIIYCLVYIIKNKIIKDTVK